MELSDKVAVVTGAAGGIGLGLSRACAAKGMKVVISDLDGARLAGAATQLRDSGATVVDHACDVRDRAEVEGLRDAALDAFGSIDLACNNAGVGLARPVLECTDADWDLLLDVNVRGVANGIRTFLPVLTEQGAGHINATSSLSGLVGDPSLVVYNATKFAVVGMMEGLAQELASDHPGISVSVLCPGPVATDLMATSEKQLADAGSDATSDEDIAAYLAAGMHPDDVGRLAIDGIAEGDFWLVTHPEYTWSITDPRYEAMKRGELAPLADDWTQHR